MASIVTAERADRAYAMGYRHGRDKVLLIGGIAVLIVGVAIMGLLTWAAHVARNLPECAQ